MSDRLREDAIKLDALIRLGLGRQAQPLDARTQEVYLDDLEEEAADVVVEACTRLRRAEREKYETAYPPVGAILAECRRVKDDRQMAAWRALAATAPKQLPAAAETPELTRTEASARLKVFREAFQKRVAAELKDHDA